PNCIERRDSTVALQALHLMNNGMINQLAADFARRVKRDAGAKAEDQVYKVYLIALSRTPNEQEKKLGLEALKTLTAHWAKHTAKSGKLDPDTAQQEA